MRLSEASGTNTATHTADTPRLLLEHGLKELRLPTILCEYDKVACQCAVELVDYALYLLRMTELELLDRERRATDRRIRQAKFPVIKAMDSFDFMAIPSLNKTLVLELARCEFLTRRENVLLLGNSGTGKTFAMYAGAVICLGGLIFAGIRMMTGRFQDAIPGPFGALFGAAVLGWGAGWIGSRFAYVSVSRASHDAQIYTNDAAALTGKLSQDVSKSAAVSFGNVQSNSIQQGLALSVR